MIKVIRFPAILFVRKILKSLKEPWSTVLCVSGTEDENGNLSSETVKQRCSEKKLCENI